MGVAGNSGEQGWKAPLNNGDRARTVEEWEMEKKYKKWVKLAGKWPEN